MKNIFLIYLSFILISCGTNKQLRQLTLESASKDKKINDLKNEVSQLSNEIAILNKKILKLHNNQKVQNKVIEENTSEENSNFKNLLLIPFQKYRSPIGAKFSD